MKKFIFIIITASFFISMFVSCGKKEKHMVDMDIIKTDGSRDDKYIFKKEIEKEEHRSRKYKRDQF